MPLHTKGSSHQEYRELPTQGQNGKEVDKMADVVDDAPAQCGLGSLRCRCLNFLASPNVFVLCVGLLFTTSAGANVFYMSGIISTIEKRFQLKSSESGLLLSMNDISSLCGVLFLTHFGGRSHRPRIIGISGLVIAVGTLITALPQVLFDNPALEGILKPLSNGTDEALGPSTYEQDFTCSAQQNTSLTCTDAEIRSSGSQFGKTWPMILGQLLYGVGGTALIPLSATYVDDAVEKAILPIYMAMMFLPMTVAPLMGYAISGYCLSLFTNFYNTDVSELGITPRDPEWQGAWWLGFLIYGCLVFLFSLPLFFFPRKMEKFKNQCSCFGGASKCCTKMMGSGLGGGRGVGGVALSKMTAHRTESSSKPMAAIKEFLASIWRLLTNPLYMVCVIGICVMAISFSGFAIFSAKYIQFEFNIPPSRAGMVLGFALMPCSLFGIIFGGIVTSRVGGSSRGYAKLTLVAQCLCAFVYAAMMFVGCPNSQIAGITTQYGGNGVSIGTESVSPNASCNSNCACEKGVYSPVCGSDNVTYVTACFAGCQFSEKDQDDRTIYQNCSCISSTHNKMADEPTSGFAFHGACADGCNILLPFLFLLGVGSAISAMSHNPSFMMTFRSVNDKDRDLSLGLTSFIVKIVAFIPTPILLGATIESQCMYWQESCDATGECLLYDRPGLRFAFIGFTVGFRFLAFLFFCIATYFIFKRAYEPHIAENEGDGDDEKKVVPDNLQEPSIRKETDV